MSLEDDGLRALEYLINGVDNISKKLQKANELKALELKINLNSKLKDEGSYSYLTLVKQLEEIMDEN